MRGPRGGSYLVQSIHDRRGFKNSTRRRQRRAGSFHSERALAGLACVLRFPSPLRRRYAAGPVFGLRHRGKLVATRSASERVIGGHRTVGIPDSCG